MAPSGTGQAVKRYTPNIVVVATGREWRLATRRVPPGGSGAARVLEGTWRLAM